MGEAENQINLLRQIFEADSTNTAVGENLDKAEKILEELREQTLEIEKRIAVIEKNPKVMGKTIEDAELENRQREAQKIEDKFKEQILPEAESLGQEIIDFSFKLQDDWARKENSHKELISMWDKIREKIGELRSKADSKDFGFYNEIKDELEKAENIDDFLSMLQERREKLGMFSGAKKKAIDSILVMDYVFASIRTKDVEYRKHRDNYDADDKNRNEIKERFKGLVEKAWDVEDKVNTLLNKERMPELPSSIYSVINQKVVGAADIKRYEGNKEVGRYDGWFNATNSDPKIRTLYSFWESTQKGVDIYMHRKNTGDKK